MKASIVSAVSLLASAAFARTNFAKVGKLIPPPHVVDTQSLSKRATNGTTGSGNFTQLLDHNDPSKGTFQQQYWYSSEYWAGPGSPVVFFTPGEAAAAEYTGYLRNTTITGLFAQEIKGAVILVEHRFWGGSSPYENLTTENLQLLTLPQAIADFVNIAETIDLPFDTNHSSNAANAPWIFSGGSYSGALAAWTESTSPGTFWAYHASSAPVEAIYDYWQYFAPVQQGMPANCSKDVSLVIDYVDDILINGNASAKKALKAKFGLATLEHDADFGSMLQNGPWLWQGNSFYTGYSAFYEFCDAVENVTAGALITPGAEGVGLEVALAGYANWVNATLIPGYCESYGYEGDYNLDCMNTYDNQSLLYTDTSVDNVIDRQWQWLLCNEPFAYWQDGAPANTSSIVSRLVTAEYWQRQCELFFPEVNGFTFSTSNKSDLVGVTNKYTKGWALNETTRLTWTNGQHDPWRTSGVSSEFRPGGALNGTSKAPVNVIPDGFHCSDLILKNGVVNEGVQAVIDREVKQIVEWVAEFYA